MIHEFFKFSWDVQDSNFWQCCCVDWWTFTDVSGWLFFRLKIRQTQDGWFTGLLRDEEGATLFRNVGKIFASLYSTECSEIRQHSIEIAGTAEHFEMLQEQLGAAVGWVRDRIKKQKEIWNKDMKEGRKEREKGEKDKTEKQERRKALALVKLFFITSCWHATKLTRQAQFAMSVCPLCSGGILLFRLVQKLWRWDTLRRHSPLHYVTQAIIREATRRTTRRRVQCTIAHSEASWVALSSS